MGSPLSPIIANIFIQDFETRALDTAEYKPKLWLRCVDDTFIIWTRGEDKLQNFFSHLNSIHPKIEFAMEIENTNQLPFLDVLVMKKQDGTLGRSRSQRLADTNHVRTESSDIKRILRTNGFTTSAVYRAFHAKTNTPLDTTIYVTKAYLPYIKGTTDKRDTPLQIWPKSVDEVVEDADSSPIERVGTSRISCSGTVRKCAGELRTASTWESIVQNSSSVKIEVLKILLRWCMVDFMPASQRPTKCAA
ncbi:hypothetical protein Trydic_g1172 [Trypoxylus dichotomus]